LNRGETVALLDRELDRSRREKKPFGIILADIDHFKKVNDSHGHLVGDTVLKAVARKLGSDLRTYDGAGRYGGEEFLLVLPGCDLATTLRRAEQIREGISRLKIETNKGKVQVTLSMGVTSAEQRKSADAEALLGDADIALYRAKKNGRNRVEGYCPQQ